MQSSRTSYINKIISTYCWHPHVFFASGRTGKNKLKQFFILGRQKKKKLLTLIIRFFFCMTHRFNTPTKEKKSPDLQITEHFDKLIMVDSLDLYLFHHQNTSSGNLLSFFKASLLSQLPLSANFSLETKMKNRLQCASIFLWHERIWSSFE